MKLRVGWGFLLAIVAVGLSAWLSDYFDQEGWPKVLTLAAAAIIPAFAATFVDSVRSRARLRRDAAELREPELPRGSAGLLRPERRVVPFQNRPEYDQLREWCRDKKPPVRLVVGAGGVGKTRLALELREYLRSCGWREVLIGEGKEATALSVLAETTKGSIFLVVDYAETRAGLVELLRSVLDHAAHVRVLLIARSAGDWWWRLCADVAPARKLLSEYEPMELKAELAVEADAAELVRAAVPHFARALGVKHAPRHVDVTVPVGVPLLVLHAAALVAVLRAQVSAERAPAKPLVADHEVLRELLGHEQRYWRASAAQSKLAHLSAAALKRAVAVPCLFPAADEAEAVRMLHRVPDLREDEQLRRDVARWLRELYPADTGFWGLLQPELLAETHVMEQVKDCEDLVICSNEVARLSPPRPEQARQMLTVLSHGAAGRFADRELLERVLRADLERLLPIAIEVATASGGALRAVLIRVLANADLTPGNLRRIYRSIPHPTTALPATAVVVVRRILKELPPDANRSEVAYWCEQLAVMEAQAGRSACALRDIARAVELYRALVEDDRSPFRPDLARCLHLLGMQHADRGDHDTALDYSQEAEQLYRDLRDKQDQYRPDHAACLNNVGTWLVEVDRHAAALPLLKEAVQIYWDLVEVDSGHIGRLAETLSNLSRCQRRVEPLPQLEEAVGHYRRLADNERDRYLPDLARALHALGDLYLERQDYDKALRALDEALEHYESLSDQNKRYAPDQAACYNNLGVNLFKKGRHAEAVDYARKAVWKNGELTKDSPRRYQPELARSLDNLVIFLSKMGRHDEAIQHAEVAVRLHRELAEIVPHRFRPELARALTNLGVSLSERGRHAEALPAAREAVTICRELTKEDSSQYWPHLARALDNLAVDYSALRRHADADRSRQEAHQIRVQHGCAGPTRRRWPRRDRLPRRGALPSH